MTSSDRVLTKFFMKKMNEFGRHQSSYEEGYTDGIDRCDQKLGSCDRCKFSSIKGSYLVCPERTSPLQAVGYCEQFKEKE